MNLLRKLVSSRRKRVKLKLYGIVGLAIIYMMIGAAFPIGAPEKTVHSHRRSLLASATSDCVKGQTGVVIGYLAIILFCFVGLAIICDDFFVPSLEAISEKLNLSEDVAGATFMAAGSSAPELFTSVADAFGQQNSIGVGTIVGSAMFNILVIVALAAAVTPGSLLIDWRPMMRDAFFYSLSILMLVLVFLDGQADWMEGLLMVAAYGLYILFMVFNQRIFALCGPPRGSGGRKVTPSEEAELEAKQLAAADAVTNMMVTRQAGTGEAPEGGDLEVQAEPEKEKEKEEEEEEEGRFDFPDGAFDRVLFVVSFPYLVAFTYTIPDCSKARWKAWYLVSFFNSIVWIGGLCLAMVFLASDVGCILGVDPPVMGIVVLAVGTSVPDALGSMIVAKQGEADMAIANAVGSNVFDILLGLGFPWLLSGLIKGAAQPVDRDGIEIGVAILFGTVVLFVSAIALNRFRMNRTLGVFFLILYFAYIAYTLLSEACVLKIKRKCLAPLPGVATNVTANATGV